MLDKILHRTADDVAARKRTVSQATLRDQAASQPAPVSLRAALGAEGISIIAEIKRASPSRGVFPVAVEPAEVAAAYIRGGAAALSVLTDEPFFQGHLDDLERVAAVAHGQTTPVPVLRKEFMLDTYQVVEARAFGADAILLIIAALDDAQLLQLRAAAQQWGMDVLVEVHDELEMERALRLGANLIGINNRNLRTFEIDLATTERLAPLAAPETMLVGESGIFSSADLARIGRAGVGAVLVGESLIVQDDRAAAVRDLIGTGA